MYEIWMILAVAAALAAALMLVRARNVHAQKAAQEASEPFNVIDANSSDQSPQDVCRRLAVALEANAIVVERLRDNVLVVAGAPWKTALEPLDKIALDWSFTTGLPPKTGMGNPVGSDWLFLPVHAGGRVVAVLGVTSRHGRRRFILNEQPAIRRALAGLEGIYRPKGSPRLGKSNPQNCAHLTGAT